MRAIEVSEGCPEHVDESGAPCTRHARLRSEIMISLALVGSRATGLNHDLASKLQGLLMTLEDLVERLGERNEPELHRAASEASVAAQELAGLVTDSRALTRSPGPSRCTLRELIAASGDRAGVDLAAALPEVEVDLIVPHVVHALALAIEVAAGPGRGRPLESSCRVDGGRIELVLATSKQTTSYASEYLALASAILRRDRGDVRCGDGRLVVWLPLA
jgi:signal transduction histidine kinase